MLPTYAASMLWGEGTPFGNSSLGFPFGIEQRYYPTADVLQNLMAGLIAAITGNPFLGMNAVFAASFPLTALAAWWVMRLTGLRGAVAVTMALVVALIPYHWLRVEHVYLATMYSAVLGAGMALLIGSGRLEEWWRERDRGRMTFVLLISLVIASSGIYYACFAILLGAVAVLYRYGRGAEFPRMLGGMVPLVLVGVVTALTLAPAWWHERTNPPLDAVAGRLPAESAAFSGILTNVLLPAPISQLPGIAPVNEFVSGIFQEELEAPTGAGVGVLWHANFGSVSTTLALGLFAVGGLLYARRARTGSADSRSSGPEAGVSAGLIVVLLGTSILFFVPWGLNFLFANVVTAQLRGWDRLVPVILTLFVAGAGLTWSRLGFPQTGLRAWFASGAIVVVLLLDSVTPFRAGFDTAAEVGEQTTVYGEAYAAALNESVPGQCGVLQLPHLGYPEALPREDLSSYAHLIPALTNSSKDWSFGAMKGTVADAWLQEIGSTLDDVELRRIADVGFCAVHVDLRGYTGEDGAVVLSELHRELGAPVAVGLEGQWVAFAVPDPAQSGGLSADALAGMPDDVQTFFAPPRVEPAPGSSLFVEPDTWGDRWWLTDAPGVFSISTIKDEADFDTLRTELQATSCGDRRVTISASASGRIVEESVVLAAGERREVVLEFPAAVAAAEVSVRADGELCQVPDGRYLSVAVVSPSAEHSADD